MYRRPYYITNIKTKAKETIIDKLLSFIELKPIFIIFFLFLSFLYNIGYFLETDYRYISFLTYADFLYGTIPFIILYSLVLFFISFVLPFILVPNICSDICLYTSEMNSTDFWHKFVYKEIRLKSLLGGAIQNIITGHYVDDEYISYPMVQYEQELNMRKCKAKKNIGKNSKYKRFLAKIRCKIKNPYKKICYLFTYIIKVLILLFMGSSVLILIFSWVIIYLIIKCHIDTLSISSIVGNFNYIWSILYILSCLVVSYFILKDKIKIPYFICTVLIFYAPLIGEELFLSDLSNATSTVITTDKEEYPLVRRISTGYFSKKEDSLVFIPQNNIEKVIVKNIQNHYKKEN